MIPAPPLSVACRNCGRLHEDPQNVISSTWATNIYSDLERVVLSNRMPRPKYVWCQGCGRVGLRAHYLVLQSGHYLVRPAKWVEASPLQAAAALDSAQAPFLADSREAHELRLWLWRKENHRIRAGFPVADPLRREAMLEVLLTECRAFTEAPLYRWVAGGVGRQKGSVEVPVHLFLEAEIHRQRREFEEAANKFKMLCEVKGDAVLAWYSRQQMDWCAEGRSTLEVLQSYSRPADEAPVDRTPIRIKHKFVIAASSRETRDRISAWVNFPDRAMTVENLKVLCDAATICDPLAGIIVSEQDVSAIWPGEAGAAAFIDSLVKINRSVSWLVVGDLPRARALVTTLRLAGFPASSIDSEHLTHARFESWALHGKRKVDRQWRRVRKFA